MTAAAITLHNVTLAWGKHVILPEISGSFMAGHITAIVGPNGSGKSTLVSALTGLLPVRSGRISRTSGAQSEMALLPQQAHLDRDFPITTFDLVSMGIWRQIGPHRSLSPAHRDHIMCALTQVGLVGEAQAMIGTLSGGQLQRALFARMLVRQAQVMILDEPFAAVDEETQEELLVFIKQWREQGKAVIIVLHDQELVQRIADETLILARQVVAWGPTTEVLTDDNMRLAQRLSRRAA